MSGSYREQDLRHLDDEEQNAYRLGQIKTIDVTDLLRKGQVVENHGKAGCHTRWKLGHYSYIKKSEASTHLSISYRK